MWTIADIEDSNTRAFRLEQAIVFVKILVFPLTSQGCLKKEKQKGEKQTKSWYKFGTYSTVRSFRIYDVLLFFVTKSVFLFHIFKLYLMKIGHVGRNTKLLRNLGLSLFYCGTTAPSNVL